MKSIMKTIKKVGVLSAARITAILFAVLGLLVGVIYGCIFTFMGVLSGELAMVVLGLALIFIAPLFYGALGFVVGAIKAWIYNVVAKKFGGVEVELE